MTGRQDVPCNREILDRVISFRDYVAIGFGVIVGVGWVVYAGQWILTGGVLGAVLAFVLAGVLLIPVGKCYAELTAAMPVTGGEVAFAYKAFGPFVSFLAAWALSLTYIAVTPFETIAVGVMTEALVPAIATPTLYTVGGFRIAWSTIVPGLLAGVWVIWLNWRGARDMARFQTVAITGLIGCTVAFSIVAFVNGDVSHLAPLFAGGGDWAAIPASIAGVLVVVPFFLAGFDCIPQAAEEAGVKMNSRQLGVAILSAIAMGVAFYVVIILALGFSVSNETLTEIVADPDQLPMAAVLRESFGVEWAAQLVLVAAMLGILSTLNGIFMAATRLLFALGRGGLLPHGFAVLHPVNHTPKNAILFVGAIALAGPFIGKAGLAHIIYSNSLVLSTVFLVTALATLRLRRTAPDLARPYRVHPFTIWLAIGVGVLMVGLMTVPGSPGRMGAPEFITFALWMVLGLAFYALRGRVMDRDRQAYMILGDYR